MQKNLRTAIELYKQAAEAGNELAKSLLTPHSKDKHELCRRESALYSSLHLFLMTLYGIRF